LLVVVAFVVVCLLKIEALYFKNPNERDGPSPKFLHNALKCVVSLLFDTDGMKILILKHPEPFSQPRNLGN
jgi:hypothetical protein